MCVCTVSLLRPQEQVKLVQRVKGYENGFISNPAVMSPTCTVADLDDLKAERNISGTSVLAGGCCWHFYGCCLVVLGVVVFVVVVFVVVVGVHHMVVFWWWVWFVLLWWVCLSLLWW